MAYFADLSACTYFGETPGLLAIGWLDAGVDYPHGPLMDGFADALAVLLVRPWQPAVCAGIHRCPFCRLSGGPGHVHFGDHDVECGTNNLFVPWGKQLFVAPSLILHYVDAHEYSPPEAFQRAVLDCPPMRSMGYLKALRESGVLLKRPS